MIWKISPGKKNILTPDYEYKQIKYHILMKTNILLWNPFSLIWLKEPFHVTIVLKCQENRLKVWPLNEARCWHNHKWPLNRARCWHNHKFPCKNLLSELEHFKYWSNRSHRRQVRWEVRDDKPWRFQQRRKCQENVTIITWLKSLFGEKCIRYLSTFQVVSCFPT